MGTGGGGAHQAREGQLEEEEVGGALVAPDLAQRDGAGFVAVRFARDGVACWEGVAASVGTGTK